MSNKLKPCPFCGATDMLSKPYYHESYVHCQSCGCDGPAADYNKCDDLWNSRVEPAKIKLTKTLPSEPGQYYWSESLEDDIHIAYALRDTYTGHMNIEIESFKCSAIYFGGYWAKVEQDQFEFEG